MVRGVAPDAQHHDGAWGARASAVAKPAWAYVTLPATYPELYARTWFSVTSRTTPVTLLRLRNHNGGLQVSVGISKTGILIAQNNRAAVTLTSTIAVGTGTWHEVQIHALMAKGTLGRLDVWFDGAPVTSLSGSQKVGPTPVGRVQIGDNVAHTFDVSFDDVAVDTAYISDGQPADASPPSEPLALTATAPSWATVRLIWSASTDDVGVTGYDVFRSDTGGPAVHLDRRHLGSTSYTDTTVQADSDFSYKVDAFDAAGNHSSRSDAAGVHTPVYTASPPNIVLILTDDQRYDMLGHMAGVHQDLVDQGVTFSNGFVSDSLCCPSRTSTLRGQYSHTTGVYDIDGHVRRLAAACTLSTSSSRPWRPGCRPTAIGRR